MEEQGLAQQAGQEQDASLQAISQIVELLMQGVTPEELIKQGVDPKLVEQAIQLLRQQQPQPQQQVAPRAQEPGLAQQMVQG